MGNPEEMFNHELLLRCVNQHANGRTMSDQTVTASEWPVFVGSKHRQLNSGDCHRRRNAAEERPIILQFELLNTTFWR